MPTIKNYFADQAAEWLQAYLTNHGETPSRDVKEAAARRGYGESSLYRACRRLGVRIRSEGFERGKRTLWSLTTDGSEVTVSTVPTDRTEPTDLVQDPPEFDIEIGTADPSVDILTTVNRELHAAKSTDEASTPPCPSCGATWSVRELGPPPHWHCFTCGKRYPPAPAA